MTAGGQRTGDDPRLGILYRCVMVAMFALMSMFAKLAADSGIPLNEIIFFRGAVALVPVLIFIAAGGGLALIKTERPIAHVVRAAIGGTGMIFVFLGVVQLPLTESTSIGFSVPIIATVLSAVLLKERVGPHRWAATLVGFGGVILLLHPDPGKMIALGAIFSLIGACFTAVVTITVRQLSATESPVTIAFYFMLMSALAFALTLPFSWVAPSPEQLFYLAGVGLSGGLAQIIMGVSVRYAPVSTLVPFDYSQIIWTILISWLLWDQLPGTNIVLGVSIVIASGLYIVYREHKRRVPSQPVANALEEN